jgi:hypothetical protein
MRLLLPRSRDCKEGRANKKDGIVPLNKLPYKNRYSRFERIFN